MPTTRLAHRAALKDARVNTRLQDIADSLTDVIRMGRGDPDFDTPAHIVRAGQEALANGATHYTHAQGILPLRQAIANDILARGGASYTPEQIVVTPGAQQALFTVALGLLDPGDEMVAACPGYHPYHQAAELAGARVVDIRTTMATNFTLTAEMVEAHITPKTKIVVVVNPSNPTGTVTPPEEVARIAEVAKSPRSVGDLRRNLRAAHLRRRPHPAGGRAARHGRAHDHDLGVLEDLRDDRLAHRLLRRAGGPRAGACRHPQRAGDFDGGGQPARGARRAHRPAGLRGRDAPHLRRAARGTLRGPRAMGIPYAEPQGAFFVYANVASVGLGATAFCEKLLREGKVLVFPGVVYGDYTDDFVRLSLTQPVEKIREACARMAAVVAAIRA